MRPNNYTRGPQVQRTLAHAESLPAPIGGWNARDSLAAMAPTDAVTLTNLFPTQSSCVIRGGSTNWATGMSGNVETIMPYSGGATGKLFAIDAIGNKIYDVTSAGAVGGAVVSGLTNARWKSNNIATSGGDFLYAANGVDKPLLYNGTTWTPIDAGSSPAITGVTTTLLNTPFLFQNRQWFLQNNTLKTWYLPTQSIGGAANFLDMSAYCTRGGYLVDAFDWTIDAGYGLNDMLGFITSNGEVVIWRGTDPASAATWALVGVWQLGSPIGTRCSLKWGGDVLLITQDGVVPLAQALQSSRLDPRVALSDKIQLAISDAIGLYGSDFGWQMLYFPPKNAVILNVPVTTGAQQYVMNTVTSAWCNFTGWNASCIAIFNDVMYFGGNGKVLTGWDNSYSDNGVNIVTSAQQAFNYFESRGTLKYFTRARPMITTNSAFGQASIGIAVDFNLINAAEPIPFPGAGAVLWDSAKWDQATWGQGLQVNNSWQGVTGIGYCGSVQFMTSSAGTNIQWSATDVVFQTGWAGI